MRTHIFGASGSGTTTLARALAASTRCPHFDVDDFYWMPTDPPFEVKRPVPGRITLLRAKLEPTDAWVLSGSLVSWGSEFVPLFDVSVFLFVPHGARLARLRQRERLRYGADAIGPGGIHEAKSREFLGWASGYESDGFVGRSLAIHERWMSTLPCPVIRLDGDMPPDALLSELQEQLHARGKANEVERQT